MHYQTRQHILACLARHKFLSIAPSLDQLPLDCAQQRALIPLRSVALAIYSHTCHSC